MDCCYNCMEPLEASAAVCPFCGKPRNAAVPEHHLPCGTLLRDRYLVGAALGEGGFGITYIGRDVTLDIRVAIKEYYPNGFTNRNNTVSLVVTAPVTADRKEFFEKGRASFLKEARALGKFSQEPGIVNVRDFFEENNTVYIVMEYLNGVTLKEHLKKTGPIRYDELLPMMLPLMRSLERVHGAGLIHRDISPDNIMMVGDSLKLLDFGAARSVSAEGNRSLSVMLKPGYAPEEQYRSRGRQGPWTDAYALCATVYKCLTGVTPDDATERMYEDTLQPPSALGAAIPPAAEQALMRGLAVLAKDRLQSVEELIDALLSADDGPMPFPQAEQTQDGAFGGAYFAPADGYARMPDVPPQAAAEPEDGACPPEAQTENTGLFTDAYDHTMLMDETPEETAPLYEPESDDDYTRLMGGRNFGNEDADEYTHLMDGGFSFREETRAEPPADRQSDTDESTLLLEDESREEAPAAPEQPEETEKKSKLPLFIVLGLLLAALIIIPIILGEHDANRDSGNTSGNAPQPVYRNDHSTEPDDGAYEDPPDTYPDDTWEEPEEPVYTKTLDFGFTLEGVHYTLPCSFDELSRNGWDVEWVYDAEETTPGKDRCAFPATYRGSYEKQVTLEYYNGSTSARPVSECRIGYISVWQDGGASIVLDNGITFGSSYEAVQAAFGQPDEESEDSDNTKDLIYCGRDDQGEDQRIAIRISTATDSVTGIYLEYYKTLPDDAVYTVYETPSYLSAYRAPSSMSISLADTVFILEGALYRLPAPLSAFTDNGWTLDAYEQTVPGLNSDPNVWLERNGVSVRVRVKNFSEYQLETKNCVVCEIHFSEQFSPDVNFSIAGGIGYGSTFLDLRSAAGIYDVAEYGGSDDRSYYCISDTNNDTSWSYDVCINKGTNRATEITVSNYDWNY